MKRTDAWKRGRRRKVYRITQKMIRDAIAKGEVWMQREIAGGLEEDVWLDLGWSPISDTYDPKLKARVMTIRMRVPKMPWE